MTEEEKDGRSKRDERGKKGRKEGEEQKETMRKKKQTDLTETLSPQVSSTTMLKSPITKETTKNTRENKFTSSSDTL